MNGKRKRHSIDQTVESLLPESVRKDCLMRLRESIIRANEGGSNKWGVYHNNNRIRLLVGGLIIFTIERKGIWLALDSELLDRWTEKLLDNSPDWLWAGKGEYPIYKIIQLIEETIRNLSVPGLTPTKLGNIRSSTASKYIKLKWMRVMAARRRKTLIVCQSCHNSIHYGRYDGTSLSKQVTGELCETEIAHA